MGYGSESVSGRHTIPGLGSAKMGKASGGGVKLDRKSIGKLTQSEDDVFSGKETQMEDNSMAKAGVVSGSHSGNFMATPKYKGTAKKGLHSPTKMLSEKQSKVIDGADGSKKDDKIQGSEMAALSKK